MASISVFLITLNEEERLGRTLRALRDWADQIVVVDSGSSDRTCEIARAAGAEVHTRAFDGYGPQKRFGEDLCRNDWILNLDADEVVTDALAGEIQAFVADDPAPTLCRIRILNVYPGDATPRRFANDYNVVRLYHRNAGRYRDDPLFDRVVASREAPTQQMAAPIHHFPFLTFAAFIDKQNRYSSFAATAAKPRNRLGLMVRLPFEGPLWFLRFYIGRRHVTGGWKGFAFAASAGFARFLRIVKLLERRP